MKSSILKELQRIELAIRGIDPLADIAELEAAQSDMQALISALQAEDTSLQSQISGNDSDISALQAADTSLQSQISGNDTDISGHNSRIVALEALGGATGLSVAVLHDQKPPYTVGGDFIAGAWRTRDLNTIVSDVDNIVTSLAGNQFTLPAGSYLIMSSSPGYKCSIHTASIYDVTNNVRYLGSTLISHQGDSTQTVSVCRAALQLVAPATLEVQHQCYVSRLGNGLGVQSIFTGVTGVFSSVLVIKL